MRDEVSINIKLRDVKVLFPYLEKPNSFTGEAEMSRYSGKFILSKEQYSLVQDLVRPLQDILKSQGFDAYKTETYLGTPLKTRSGLREKSQRDVPEAFEFMLFAVRSEKLGAPKLSAGHSDSYVSRGAVPLDIDVTLRTSTLGAYGHVWAEINSVLLREPRIPVVEAGVGRQVMVDGKVYFISEKSEGEVRREAMADAFELLKCTGFMGEKR